MRRSSRRRSRSSSCLARASQHRMRRGSFWGSPARIRPLVWLYRPDTGRSAMRRDWRKSLYGLAIVAALGAPCASAQDYPNRTIRFIVPFGAGGPTDVFTRALAEELRKSLGQPIVMENRPGAGTVIGTTEVARAAPDGYTLLMISATQTTVETLNPNKSYQLMRDFVPVAALMNSELVLVVPQRSPVNTLKELIALAKAKPGTLNYGSSGLGSNYHMAGEL